MELQDEKIEREASRYGEALPLAFPEELVVDEFRDHKIKNLQKKKKEEMLPRMEKNFTESITDGLTVTPSNIPKKD